ncbi:MAG TPA: anthrone oxygenase family protein [Mycobacteriales bacterium]|nr:anthrone oxygenase family protein [Mycobacteriales bacterium]
MIDGYPRILTVVTALGAGLSAGVFFAFSTFVMKGIGKIPPASGIRAMQSMNKYAPNSLFGAVLFATAGLCVFLSVTALRRLREPSSIYLLVGSGAFLVAIIVTVVYHIPHNDSLAGLNPNAADSAAEWNSFQTGWNAWNHVRTLSSLVGAVAFTLALRAE